MVALCKLTLSHCTYMRALRSPHLQIVMTVLRVLVSTTLASKHQHAECRREVTKNETASVLRHSVVARVQQFPSDAVHGILVALLAAQPLQDGVQGLRV